MPLRYSRSCIKVEVTLLLDEFWTREHLSWQQGSTSLCHLGERNKHSTVETLILKSVENVWEAGRDKVWRSEKHNNPKIYLQFKTGSMIKDWKRVVICKWIINLEGFLNCSAYKFTRNKSRKLSFSYSSSYKQLSSSFKLFLSIQRVLPNCLSFLLNKNKLL